MKKMNQIVVMIFILLMGCATEQKKNYEIAGEKSKVIKELIDAVNKKDAETYAKGFDEKAQVFVDSQLKVNGKESLIQNRARHFEMYPDVRSEIQHLVEIDDKVVMHDKVWLNDTDLIGQNIVEIFTFENGKIIRVDVIQPNDLFQNR